MRLLNLEVGVTTLTVVACLSFNQIAVKPFESCRVTGRSHYPTTEQVWYQVILAVYPGHPQPTWQTVEISDCQPNRGGITEH